jgi:hypothetical protein
MCSPAKSVAGGIAERVESADYDDGDSNDQQGVFSSILTGLLAPEAFEKRKHLYGTFDRGGLTRKG